MIAMLDNRISRSSSSSVGEGVKERRSDPRESD